MSVLPRNFPTQKGFTLIEMSIVLVIIGLIIGGILKGQEIVESSRSKNVLSEVERVRAAANTFIDRYKALPGDFQLAQGVAGTGRITTDATIINGNGNGIIGPAAASDDAAGIIGVSAGGAGTAGTMETPGFWSHLSAAKLVGGITPTAAAQTGGFGEGTGTPSTAFPGTGMTIAYGLYGNLAGAEAQGHWLRIHKGTPSVPAAGLLAKQLQAIDVRIDDGLPGQGAVRTGIVAAPCGTPTINVADYQPTVETVSCIALIQLLQ